MLLITHPDGSTCAGTDECNCTKGVASASWSGKAGGPRYCKSKYCIVIGIANGHIIQREKPAAASGKRPAGSRDDDDDDEPLRVVQKSSSWWPVSI
eukprot:39886-Prymnesium_polylepis.1